jgi:hypothetical protein
MNAAYKALTQEWLSKAQSDLLFAEASLREFSGFYSQICVLCHDSAEKYLKTFLIAHGIRPDRVHDLMALLHECLKIDALANSRCHPRMSLSGIHDFSNLQTGFPIRIASGMTNCEGIKIDATLCLLDMACSILNDYYIPLKYPSHYPDIIREQSAEAFDSVKLIQAEIEKRICI